MNKEAQKLYKKVLESLIRRSAVSISINILKHKGSLNIPMLYPIITLLVVIGVSVLMKLWWLIIPVGIIYFVIDWKIRYNKVVKLLPTQMIDIIEGLLSGNEEELEETISDLKIKTDNNIYNADDIEEKTKKISFLTSTVSILEELKKNYA